MIGSLIVLALQYTPELPEKIQVMMSSRIIAGCAGKAIRSDAEKKAAGGINPPADGFHRAGRM